LTGIKRLPAASSTLLAIKAKKETTLFKNILVPTDGTALSAASAREAVKFAKSVGAGITGFYAAPEYTIQVYGDFVPPDMVSPKEFTAITRKAAEKYLGIIEKIASAAGVKYEGYFAKGDRPYVAIINAAKKKKCDLIFMASHGRSGIAGLVLGSETTKVLTHSKIPVLVHR